MKINRQITTKLIIDTEQALASVVKRARETGFIAIDTEFVWERTYYPTLGIVQLGFSREESFILDALALRDISSLGETLFDPSITKILHDAQQDLIILRRATGTFPQNIFDTRLAGGFAGLSSSISLSALLKELLGVKLAKTETRSDWLKRPLTSRQVDYALDDVRYLPLIREKLLSKTEDLKHTAWLTEELVKYDNHSLYEENSLEEQFLRIKGVSKLGQRRRMLVRELARWREETARHQNCPRAWVLADQVLINIAQHRPRNITELSAIEGLNDNTIRKYGTHILDSIDQGLRSTERDNLRPAETPEGKDHLSARVDLALAYIKGKSIAGEIDPALVANRAEVTLLAQETGQVLPENHRLLSGWRREFIGEDLMRLLAGQLAVQMDVNTGLPVRALDV